MNNRLVTVCGVLLALILIVGMFIQPDSERPTTRPTSVELGPNGYGVLRAWLAREGIAVESVQERLVLLADDDTTGSLIITTLPHDKPLRQDEIVELLSWIARGNTLLVLAALDDTPDWSLLSDGSLLEDIERLLGATFEAASDPEEETVDLEKLLQQSRIELLPANPDHPLNRGVYALTAYSDSMTSAWTPTTDSVSPGTPFLSEVTHGLDAGWVDNHGTGHIVTIAVGSMFTNRSLSESDNRILMTNLVRWHMGEGGRVFFDDFHQGLSNLYDPEAFYSDSRVGVTILFLLAFWFIYMVGTQNRLAPVRPPVAAPRQGEFVTALGGFLARKVSLTDTALLMFERWFAELTERGILQQGASPWDSLAGSPLVDGEGLATLQAMYKQSLAGARVDLKQLHNRIQSIREALG